MPNSAIKTTNGASYIQVVAADTAVTSGSQTTKLTIVPEQRQVTVGISDDSSTEIVSGLSEGEKIISKTVAAKTTTSTSGAAPSLFGSGGGGRAGGNAGGRAVTP